jgi:acetyl esterase/lipase
MSDDETALHIPAQTVPVPKSLSPQAQAFLAAAAKRIAAPSSEALSIPTRAAAAVQMLRPAADRFRGTFKATDLPGGAKLYRAIPDGREGRRTEVAFFDIHGGGFVAGGGEMCRLLAKIRAADYGVEVISIDYRLLPDHPYPAGLDDCMAAYSATLAERPASAVVVGGASAGGNLAAAVMLRARDEGLPLPAGLMLLTPALDMTRSGDSFKTNQYLDVNLDASDSEPWRYGAGYDLKHPYVSPLYGDFSKGWPPTILATGTRDLLLSDTVRMHRALRRAGVAAELHVTEAGPHGGFMGQAPEDADIIAECGRFMFGAWGIAR